MPSFYSTFTPGFEEAVEHFFPRDMPGCGIERVYRGAVHYKRKGGLLHPPWAGNTYLALMSFGRIKGEPCREMARLAALRGVDMDTLTRFLPPEASSMRALFMLDDAIAHVGPKTLQSAEEFLQNASALAPNRAKPDVEFWFVYKTEGYGFLLMRLTAHKRGDPGALRADTASLLCRLAEPGFGQCLLDPFAATGSIVGAALGYDGFKRIVASDAALGSVNTLKARFARAGRVEILRSDPLKLLEVAPGSVDAVVTQYALGGESARAFCAAARNVLKKEGMLVALCPCPQEMRAALKQNFALEGVYEALIAGKALSAYCARKR